MNRSVRTLLVVCIALLMPIVPFLAIGELPGERWLSSTDENAMRFAAAGSGLLLVDVLLPIPSSVVITLLGGRLGFTAGWMAAWLGLTLGNLLGYGIGRLWPRSLAPDLPSQPTMVMLFLSRPVPIVAEAMTLTAGATRASPLAVAATCAGGNAIYAGLLAASGAALLTSDLSATWLVLPMLVPVTGWTLWQVLRKKRHRTGHY